MSTQKPLIIVTGASRGLGLAITDILLKKLNTRVVAISRSKTPELLNLASEDLEIIQCDVTDEAGFTAAITNTEQKYGTIDGLILNAAILEPFGLIGNDVPLSRWRAHFEVNFFSLVTAVRAALPALRKSEHGGRIVFVSSTAATGSNASWGPYNAGKAAMNSLCRTLGEEEPRVISVAVEPGMVDTGMQEFIRSNKGDAIPEDLHKMFIDVHAEGKLVRPEEAGHVLAALAVRAPADYSGKFISWDGDECKPFRSNQCII